MHQALTDLSEMDSKEIKRSKCTVLFPDELNIVGVMGKRFHADNWFKYMSDQLKEKRSISEKFENVDSDILEKGK